MCSWCADEQSQYMFPYILVGIGKRCLLLILSAFLMRLIRMVFNASLGFQSIVVIRYAAPILRVLSMLNTLFTDETWLAGHPGLLVIGESIFRKGPPFVPGLFDGDGVLTGFTVVQRPGGRIIQSSQPLEGAQRLVLGLAQLCGLLVCPRRKLLLVSLGDRNAQFFKKILGIF